MMTLFLYSSGFVIQSILFFIQLSILFSTL